MVDYVELLNDEVEVREADDSGDEVRGWIQPTRLGYWWIRNGGLYSDHVREFWMQDLTAVKERIEQGIADEAATAHTTAQMSLIWD